MSLKASWFNFGIYKNALRRFKWGSVLYFVILFFSVPFMFFVGEYSYGYYQRYLMENTLPQMIIERDFLIIPILTAYAVPIIVAVIMHRYMHETRQSVAVHSLPLTRRGNYISNLFAGFTLMAAPVLANGLILFFMSLTGFGKLFAPVTVLYWIAINLSVLFIMFSVSTFSAFLTGNSAAHIVITLILHALPIIVACGIAFFSEVFLYGFVEAGNSAAMILLENTPFAWIFNNVFEPLGKGFFGTVNMLVYMISALVLYVGGYMVYKLRKVESCGDVAAFKIVRHILKYGVTAVIMLVVSAIAYEAEFNLFVIVVLNLIFGGIAYFATEMVLSKSLKVFGKYKGFVLFCVVVFACVCFFAYTNVFGFETRVPEAEQVKKATIYSYSETVPYVDEENFIRHVTDIHKELIEDIPVINPTHYVSNRVYSLQVSYELKNGNKLDRRYYMSENDYNSIMTSMYENETYKLKAETLYYLNLDKLNGLQLEARLERHGTVYTYYFTDKEAVQLMNAYKLDLLDCSWQEISAVGGTAMYFTMEIRARDENDEPIAEVISSENIKEFGYIPYSFNFRFDSGFERTVALLKEWGYCDRIIQTVADNLYICTMPVSIDPPMNNDDTMYSFKEDTGYLHEFLVNLDDCAKLTREDGMAYTEYLQTKKNNGGVPAGSYYAVFRVANPDDENIFALETYLELIDVSSVPDYLKKYVQQ